MNGVISLDYSPKCYVIRCPNYKRSKMELTKVTNQFLRYECKVCGAKLIYNDWGEGRKYEQEWRIA